MNSTLGGRAAFITQHGLLVYPYETEKCKQRIGLFCKQKGRSDVLKHNGNSQIHKIRLALGRSALDKTLAALGLQLFRPCSYRELPLVADLIGREGGSKPFSVTALAPQ
jgi:hypothetical protein